MASVAYKLKVVCYTTFFSFMAFFSCMLINCKQIDGWFKMLNLAINGIFYLQFKSIYFTYFSENYWFGIGHFHFIKTDPFQVTD